MYSSPKVHSDEIARVGSSVWNSLAWLLPSTGSENHFEVLSDSRSREESLSKWINDELSLRGSNPLLKRELFDEISAIEFPIHEGAPVFTLHTRLQVALAVTLHGVKFRNKRPKTR
jgi:hypothetical protein